MVFYRKYRPQKIEELDSKEVREKLYNVLESSSVPHAFLFTGSKGLGKTSTARIVAKVLNCEKKTKGIEPCNKCEQCVSITNGTNMDILEIDGASNRGIDEIRDLREKVKLSPMSARIKVYIIDEVHMLTQEAFNALLKTLEEPPLHALFILCTTEPEKPPATVSSRCTRITFPKASVSEVVTSLTKGVRSEGLSVAPEVLQALAKNVDGSFRDGMKYLEQLSLRATGRRKRISLEDVQRVVGGGRQVSVRRLLTALSEHNTDQAFGELERITEEEVSLENYAREILEM